MRPHVHHERGASAVEYALLIAGIAAVIVAVVLLLGGTLTGLYEDTCDTVGQTTNDGC